MHPNPAFRQESEVMHLTMARVRGFGTLIVQGDAAVPMISHVPYLLSDDGTSLELHLVRSNPIYRAAATPVAAVIAVSGPDGYVSPDWYADPDAWAGADLELCRGPCAPDRSAGGCCPTIALAPDHLDRFVGR